VADLLTTSIATAIASGATAAISDAARALVAKLVAMIRNRLRRTISDQDTLDSATRNPTDADAVRRLADLLERHMREDPEFAQQLRALWAEFTTAYGAVINVVHGQVHGSVVQVRDVHGGITLNRPQAP
jgi:CRP-like cAMP-binding protein